MPVDPVGRPSRPDAVSGARRPGPDSGPARGRGPSDEADISAEAEVRLRVHEMVSAVREAASALPDIREDKVRQARSRIEQGYYEKSEVHGTVVDTLLRNFQPLEEQH